MRMHEALNIILGVNEPVGYYVRFERADKGMLYTEYFPEKYEDPIRSEEEAWALAARFAAATRGRCINIFVVDTKWYPVPGYRERTITNRR
jgi:hypothetical protein